jgi:8-oxo-dGTP pyrophosphatase MutT (NUDIX family)
MQREEPVGVVEGGEPAPARLAATVVVARPAPDGGIEVLALRRSASSRVLPGFVVFPGGTVDDDDPDLAGRWFGSAEEAPRACALRELAEEASLALTGSGLVAATTTDDAEALALVAADPPGTDQVVPLARWLAPDFLPVRFDAHFFAVGADRQAEPLADGVEIEAAWWASPADLLAAFRVGDAPLAWPTYKTLETLAERCSSVEDVLALRMEPSPPPGFEPPGRS